MYTAPATSVSSVNAPSPVPSSTPAQNSGKGASNNGSPSPFQDVYQNLPSMQNGNAGTQTSTDTQTASKNVPQRKKGTGDDTGSAVISPATPASSTVPTLFSATLTLSPSFDLIAKNAGAPLPKNSSENAGQAVSTSTDPANLPVPTSTAADPANLPASTSPAQILSPGARQLAAQDLNPPQATTGLIAALSMPARQMVPTASSGGVEPGNTPLPVQTALEIQKSTASVPTSGLLVTPQAPALTVATAAPAKAADDSSSSDSISVPNSNPAKPLPLTADNLAFSLQLPKTSSTSTLAPAPLGNGTTTQPGDSRAVMPGSAAQPITAALVQSAAPSEAARIPSALPAAASAAPSRPLPNVSTAQNESRNPQSQDSSPRQQQEFSKPGSSQHDTLDSAKSGAIARAQAAQPSQDATNTGTLNDSPANVRSTQPAAWLSSPVQTEARPAMTLSDSAEPVRANIPAAIQDLSPLTNETPKTAAPSEIVLQLDNGQTSAAVRVVDRAGTVNVSVHSADQDLRTSLRANLSDLNMQLNSQGVKTEAPKIVASQASSENRSDQGAHEQRSSGQQHSSPQGDRQSPRDRRASSRWLEELQEQTSATAANPGGNPA